MARHSPTQHYQQCVCMISISTSERYTKSKKSDPLNSQNPD